VAGKSFANLDSLGQHGQGITLTVHLGERPTQIA
jgi:hypothetical protein